MRSSECCSGYCNHYQCMSSHLPRMCSDNGHRVSITAISMVIVLPFITLVDNTRPEADKLHDLHRKHKQGETKTD